MKSVIERIDKPLVSILAFMGFMTCIYAPIEIFAFNQSEFWFKLSMFWYIPVCLFIVALFMGYIVGCFLPPCVRHYYKAVLFAVAICIYIQGTFLNIDIGQLTGASITWSLYYNKMILHELVWFALFMAIILFASHKKEIFEKTALVASLFLSAVLFLTLCFVIIQHRDTLFVPNKELRFLSEKGIDEISSADGNIVVILLDMFDDEYAQELIDEDFEGLNSFDGFTYYTNFTGTYSTTKYSINHLFTGEMFYNECPRGEWLNSFDDTDLYMDEIIKEGYGLYLYADPVRGMIPTKYTGKAANSETGKQVLRSRLHFAADLYQLVMCKYFPDVIKPYVWMEGTEFDYWKYYDAPFQPTSSENIRFYDLICNGVTKIDTDEKQFRFVYLEGTHYPYSITSDLKEVNSDEGITSDAAECSKGCIRIVGEYLNSLKECGAYDNTSIVITADHGFYFDGSLTSPALFIKPAHSKGDLQVCDSPVCQSDYGATILALAGCDSDEYGESVFDVKEGDERDRFFYQYYLQEGAKDGNYRMIEYSVDSASNDRSAFKLTGIEYTSDGEMIDHEKYCLTCRGEAADAEGEREGHYLLVHKKADDYPD